MSPVYIQVAELPETIQSALRSVGYKRKDIGIYQATTYCPCQSGGDGYRAFACIVDIASGKRELRLGSWGGANIFSPQNAIDLDRNEYPIPDGVAVIEGSEGGNKPTYCSLTFNPNNIAKMLPAKPEVSDRQKSILAVSSYKSAYKKQEYERMNVTQEELAELVSAGFLEKRGNGLSITAKGRNAR